MNTVCEHHYFYEGGVYNTIFILSVTVTNKWCTMYGDITLDESICEESVFVSFLNTRKCFSYFHVISVSKDPSQSWWKPCKVSSGMITVRGECEG